MKLVLALMLLEGLLAEAGLNRPPLGLPLHMPVPSANPMIAERVGITVISFDDRWVGGWVRSGGEQSRNSGPSPILSLPLLISG